MPQTGISPPYKGNIGEIHTDHVVSGNSFRCCVEERCNGWLRWTDEDLDNRGIISCSENAEHKYIVISSG